MISDRTIVVVTLAYLAIAGVYLVQHRNDERRRRPIAPDPVLDGPPPVEETPPGIVPDSADEE